MNSRWSRASRRPVDNHVISLGAARHAGPGPARHPVSLDNTPVNHQLPVSTRPASSAVSSAEVASMPWAFTQHQPLGTFDFIKEAGRCGGEAGPVHPAGTAPVIDLWVVARARVELRHDVVPGITVTRATSVTGPRTNLAPHCRVACLP